MIRGGALGDFIVTLPACRLLRERWPEAEIDFLGYPRFGELGLGRYYFNQIFALESGRLARFFIPEGKLDPDWVDTFSEYDLIVSYLYDPDDIFHENLAKCCPGEIVRGSPQVTLAPAARQFITPFAGLDLVTADFGSAIFLREEDRNFAREFLKNHSRPVLAFHPGSGSPSKNWPLPHWQEIIQLSKNQGYEPLLILGETERERENELNVLSEWQARELPLPQLAAVLERCSTYLGHDSGVSHLAAAVRVRMGVLFGPTDSFTWAPPGSHVTVFKGGADWTGFTVKELISWLSAR